MGILLATDEHLICFLETRKILCGPVCADDVTGKALTRSGMRTSDEHGCDNKLLATEICRQGNWRMAGILVDCRERFKQHIRSEPRALELDSQHHLRNYLHLCQEIFHRATAASRQQSCISNPFFQLLLQLLEPLRHQVDSPRNAPKAYEN